MRLRAFFPLLLAPLPFVFASAACSGGSPGPAVLGDAGVQPMTNACTGDATKCLSGTTATKGMTAKMQYASANLFRVYPYGAAEPIAKQLVAQDGTWAFSALDPWAHYYVQIVGEFLGDASTGVTVSSVAGPLSVPSSGGPVAIFVKPVEIEAYETRQQADGQNVLVWVSAHVFDPTSGVELQSGANVAVVANGTPSPMGFSTDANGHGRYYVEFPTPVPAAATYQLTVSHPSFGSSPVTFQLVADPPTFAAALMMPMNGATVPVNNTIGVSWQPQPSVDYELVELFFKMSTGFTSVYASPAPDGPDVTMDTIDKMYVTATGTYLVNVAFAKASCPASADGCVYGNTVGAAMLTAQ